MTRRLLISYLSLAVIVLAMLEVPLGFVNARGERDQLTAKVERDAVTMASLAESTMEGEATRSTLPAIKAVAKRYASDTGARVVITDSGGTAVVDTGANTPGRRSFATRPEFRDALRGDVATGTRHSRTLGYDLLYVAVPIASGGTIHGALRISYPTSELDRRVRNYWLALAGIAAVVLAVAALIGRGFAHWISQPLEGLEEAAARAGAGDLAARAPVPEGPPEIRALALEFNEMVARVDGLMTAQRDFVADASHELRTPLTALRLRLENLERHVDQAGRERVAAATDEVTRLSRLVDSLLALARADEAVPHAEQIDVTTIARARIEAWRPTLERGVRLELDTIGPAWAHAGAERVAQVLDNLLANALRAAPDRTTVTIQIRKSDVGPVLIVRDRGPGMTQEEKARAFDRFWRAGSGTDGSGLGLAIARRLVELDGGTIELRDAPGQGLEAVLQLLHD